MKTNTSLVFLTLMLLSVGIATSSKGSTCGSCYAPLQFNLRGCTYETNKEWTRTRLGVQGGVEPLEYFYDEYPEGWRYVKQDIYTPSSALKKDQKFPCKVRIVDSRGNQARASIVFLVTRGKLTVSQTIYPYDRYFEDSFFNTQNYRGRPKMTKGSFYYNDQNDLDLDQYGYVSQDQLDRYGQKIDQLNSNSISKSTGAGFDWIYDYAYNGGKPVNTGSSSSSSSSSSSKGSSTSTGTSSSSSSGGVFSLLDFLNPIRVNGSSGSGSGTVNVNIPTIGTVSGNKGTTTTTTTTSGGKTTGTSSSGSSSSGSSSSGSSSSTGIGNIFSGIGNLFNDLFGIGSKNTGGSSSSSSGSSSSGSTSSGSTSSGSTSGTTTTRPTTGSTTGTINIFTGGSTSGSTSGNTGVINIGGGSTTTTTKTVDQYFSKLATSQQIDDYIVNSDSVSLTKLVQQVDKGTNLNCQQKASYLNDLLGRVQSAISMKSFAADQLQIVIDTANATYNSLTFQIKQNRQEITTLNIQTLKDKLQIDLTTIEGLYAQYNSMDTNVTPLQDQITVLKRDIAVQQAKSDIDRQELIRQKLSYNEADAVVKKIERQYTDAVSRRIFIESTINKYQTTITESETQVKANQDKIFAIETQINSTQSNIDSMKTNYALLEQQVTRYRTDIARGSKKQDQILPQIAILEERINIERRKLAIDQLDKLKQMISGLQRSLPTIQTFIDQNYYSCYARNLVTNKNGTAVIYIVGAADFQNYIESSYVIKPDWTTVSFPREIQLTPINILDSSWQAAYGLPYDIISFASSQDFSFGTDFNCLSPSSLQSGYGVITSIGNRYIQMNDMGGSPVRLNLGTCTRVQTTQFLPSIGQKIYWRGNPSVRTGEYNIYRASCL